MNILKFTDTCGTKRKGIVKPCLICNKEFISRIDQPRDYCSRDCSHIGKRKQVECICAWCNASFYKTKSKIRNSRSGLHFCDRKCKEAAQKLGGIKEIQPPHYGTAEIPRYRTFFSDEEMYCRRCGYKEFISSVQIHHIDKNRTNNKMENLIPLCSNCHDALHHGSWSINGKSQT